MLFLKAQMTSCTRFSAPVLDMADDRCVLTGAGVWCDGHFSAGEFCDDASGEGGVDKSFAECGALDAFDEGVHGAVFEEDAAGSGFECAEDVFVEVEGGDDDDCWGGVELLDESGCFESVAVGHADVHADDVGVESLCFGDGLLSCAGFADDGDVSGCLEDGG